MNLLRKKQLGERDVIEAVKKDIKIYAARDFLDTLLESKERDLEKYINHIFNFYPQLIVLSKEYLMETQKRLESNRSYISRFIET